MAIHRLCAILASIIGWRRASALIGAGAASALALAPINIWPVMFLTLPVLVLLLDAALLADGKTEPPRQAPVPLAVGFVSKIAAFPLLQGVVSSSKWAPGLVAFRIGWLYGFGYFLAGLYWIGAPFLVEADKFGWLLPFAVTLMPAGLALFYGAAAALAACFWRPGYPRILALATALGICEWLRGHVLTGFPWNLFGYTLTGNDALLQTASLVGVNGLTVLAVLLFASPVLMNDVRAWRHPGICGAAFGLIAAIAWGASVNHKPMPGNAAGVRLRLVQPNISQAQKWTAENKSWIFQGFLDLSRQGPGGVNDDLNGITHVVWPESSVPFLLLDSPKALQAIAHMLPKDSYLLTGGLRLEERNDGRRVYNSLIALDGEARTVGLYDKVHLVPFGEYLPLQPVLEAVGLRQLTQIRGGFTAGDISGRLLQIPGLPVFAPLICYEIIFPAAAAPKGLPGARRPAFLLNVTNDAWFGVTSGPYQHLQQTRVRAVEEGLPVIRVANTGMSAVIDARGRLLERLPLNARGTLDTGLPSALPPTLYARWGDGVLVIILLGTGLGWWLAIQRTLRLTSVGGTPRKGV